MGLLRVDLHVHSSASFDCQVPPVRVAQRCRRLGLWPVFLTDHDSLQGACTLRDALGDDPAVVLGQEVTTTGGEVIGLFLRERVPPGLSPDEAAERIKAQGGLLYLEHPYDRRRRSLNEEAIERIADQVDIVEVFNGRSGPEANRRAQELCQALGTAPGAGSDAHTLAEIGAVYVELKGFSTAKDFLANLRKARIVTHPNRIGLRATAPLRRVRGLRHSLVPNT